MTPQAIEYCVTENAQGGIGKTCQEALTYEGYYNFLFTPDPGSTNTRYWTSEKISTITSAFSLRITEVAALICVERQTIYAWLRNENDPKDDCLRRINRLFSIAQAWNRHSNLPVSRSLLHEKLFANGSLYDLLANSSMLTSELTSQFHELSVRVGEEKGFFERHAAGRNWDLKNRGLNSSFRFLTPAATLERTDDD
ncbi:MAG: hypothetical protein Q4G68_02385 [Planctomycetia bacterium]|nr:hypothetical protein [Planctomycetia bacterium]